MIQRTVSKPRRRLNFSPGQIVLDQNSSGKLSSEDIIPALSRHIVGDWGKVSRRRAQINQIALSNKKSIRSVYFSDDGLRFCVVTNGNRSITTVKVL